MIASYSEKAPKFGKNRSIFGEKLRNVKNMRGFFKKHFELYEMDLKRLFYLIDKTISYFHIAGAISTRIVGMAVMKTVPTPPVRQINLGN